MTTELDARRRALANAFDASFAAPPTDVRVATRDVLVLRLDARAFAVCVDELASVHRAKAIEPLPSAPPLCLGIAGLRGQVVVTYDFGSLVGQSSTARSSWLFQSRKDPDVAFAVPEAERYLRARADAFILRETPDADACVGALSEGALTLTVISVDRLVELIHARLPEARS